MGLGAFYSQRMEVFKFGGASVGTPQNIEKVINIIKAYKAKNAVSQQALLIVVSAMGKTTNALENILANFWLKTDFETPKNQLLSHHKDILDFFLPKEKSQKIFENISEELDNILKKLPINAYHREKAYDSLVGFGEIMSSKIMAEILQYQYLDDKPLDIAWIDARLMIKTDETWREGHLDWEITQTNIKELKPILQQKTVITQGFIGSTPNDEMITLGREGSDYSASIFASCLQAQKLTIWKDVAGVLSADPKKYPDFAQLWDNLTYTQAVTMTYYGASVIHPKTLAPLRQADIALWVKSYLQPENNGTCISHTPNGTQIKSLMTKENQILLRFESQNFQFLREEDMSEVFLQCQHCNIPITYIYKNAFQLYIVTDYREEKLAKLHQLTKVNTKFDTKFEVISTGEFWTTMYAQKENIPEILPQNAKILLQTQSEDRNGTLQHLFLIKSPLTTKGGI